MNQWMNQWMNQSSNESIVWCTITSYYGRLNVMQWNGLLGSTVVDVRIYHFIKP